MTFFIIVVLIAIPIVIYSYAAKKRREKAMAAAAVQEGWTPLANDENTLSVYLPSYLAQLGQGGVGFNNSFNNTTRSFDMAYQAKLAHGQAVFFQYEYTEYYTTYDPTTHQEEQQSQTHNFMVVRMTISDTLPMILLLHHSFLSKLATLGEHSGMEQIKLEGDFNQYFDTYITPNGQIEALSLLTPDTMQLLIDSGKNASMQIAGNTLTLTFEGKFLSPDLIKPILAGIDQLAVNISSKAAEQLQKHTSQPATTAPVKAAASPTPMAPTPPTVSQVQK